MRSKQQLVVVALAGAAVVAAALVGASLLTAGDSRPAAAPADAGLLGGIPQRGNVLGSPRAPLTLVEYADLQCPYCAQFAREALPELIRDYVRPGRLRLEFRGLAFIGPDSVAALRAAVAAGEHDRLWEVVHLLYAEQGAENSGWVTDELLRREARTAGLDGDRMLAEVGSARVDRAVARFAAAARADGVHGTPSFLLGPTGGRLEPLEVESLAAASFRPSLDAALAG